MDATTAILAPFKLQGAYPRGLNVYVAYRSIGTLLVQEWYGGLSLPCARLGMPAFVQ